jgi:Gp37 protein
VSVIVDIEDALKDRLAATIAGVPDLVRQMRKADGTLEAVPVRIESYPKQPSEQLLLTLAESGAVVLKYTGSKYSARRDVGTVSVQDREMVYDVLIFSKSLQDRNSGSGIYELLDLAALRLIGYKPAGCVDGVELLQDDCMEERKGSWTYGLLVSVKTQIERVV